MLFLTGSSTGYAASYYKVQPGDTLYLIGQWYGIPYKTIMSVNGLKTNEIWPGQVLWIPDSSSNRYLVKPGDTLYNIALRYGTSVDKLISLNGLKSTIIYPGQVLLIKEGTSYGYTSAPSRSGLSPEDIYLLAQLIRAEACGEPFEGQVAVGAVVLNRLKDYRFPKTIKDIIFEYSYGTYQFEPVMNGQIYLPPDPSSLRAAYAAMSGWDPTGGALYFYNPNKSSSNFFNNFLTYLCQIGQHIFYR